MDESTRILGIETSCDETAASVVENGRQILSSIVASQIELHAPYGGVFPEVASRAHIEQIEGVVSRALSQAHVGLEALDAIAVTRGPGLAGSLVVGVNMAKGLAMGASLPLIGVNHLEAHLYSLWLIEDEQEPEFPLLGLIVSGGHTELVLMQEPHSMMLLAKPSIRSLDCLDWVILADRRLRKRPKAAIRRHLISRVPGWKRAGIFPSAV